MKRYVGAWLVLMVVLASACSNVVTKRFKVIADPPDAAIRVVSGVELKEMKYRSPATIVAEAPKNPALAAKAVLEVKKEYYEPVTMMLGDIKDNDTLTIKLEKILRDIVRYRLSYQLIVPTVSPELQFRDKNIAVSFTITDTLFQMNFENISANDINILWERGEYTDVYNRTSRIMHSNIRFQDRNNAIPNQLVKSHSSLQEDVIPIKSVFMSAQKKTYDIRPLFQLESEDAGRFKGKSFNLFIPLEIDRQIILYNFRFEVTDSVREIIKG